MNTSETMRASILLALMASGCASTETRPDEAGAAGASAGGALLADAEAEEQAPPPPSEPPPEIALEMVVEGDVQRLSIQSRGEQSARLASAVILERRESPDDAWVALDEVALTLPDGCGASPDACIELAPGAELIVRLPLFEDPSLEACGCAACVMPGLYRLVVQSCGGEHRRVSQTLTIP